LDEFDRWIREPAFQAGDISLFCPNSLRQLSLRPAFFYASIQDGIGEIEERAQLFLDGCILRILL
jgi:hypothetical protein